MGSREDTESCERESYSDAEEKARHVSGWGCRQPCGPNDDQSPISLFVQTKHDSLTVHTRPLHQMAKKKNKQASRPLFD